MSEQENANEMNAEDAEKVIYEFHNDYGAESNGHQKEEIKELNHVTKVEISIINKLLHNQNDQLDKAVEENRLQDELSDEEV